MSGFLNSVRTRSAYFICPSVSSYLSSTCPRPPGPPVRCSLEKNVCAINRTSVVCSWFTHLRVSFVYKSFLWCWRSYRFINVYYCCELVYVRLCCVHVCARVPFLFYYLFVMTFFLYARCVVLSILKQFFSLCTTTAIYAIRFQFFRCFASARLQRGGCILSGHV